LADCARGQAKQNRWPELQPERILISQVRLMGMRALIFFPFHSVAASPHNWSPEGVNLVFHRRPVSPCQESGPSGRLAQLKFDHIVFDATVRHDEAAAPFSPSNAWTDSLFACPQAHTREDALLAV
jgi:hypothetical protein